MRQKTTDHIFVTFMPIVLAMAHLLFCIYVAIKSSDQWGWVIVSTVDFPFSILIAMLFHSIAPVLAFGILGTLWWYILGWLGAKLIIKMVNKVSMSG